MKKNDNIGDELTRQRECVRFVPMLPVFKPRPGEQGLFYAVDLGAVMVVDRLLFCHYVADTA